MVFITELIEGTKGVGPGNAACVRACVDDFFLEKQ